MIQSRQDLRRYLRQDQIALAKGRQARPALFGDEIWRFQRLLRRTEYCVNCAKGPLGKALSSLYRLRYHRRCVKLGFSLPLKVFDEGLSIWTSRRETACPWIRSTRSWVWASPFTCP